MSKIAKTLAKLMVLLAGLFSSCWAAAQGDYLVWSEFGVWAPGRPDRLRQFYFHQDGYAQFVETLNEKVVRIADVSHDNFFKSLPLDQLFDLNDNYEPPKVAGLVVEGRGNKVALIASWGGRTKFINADANLVPPLMAGLRQKMTEPSTRAAGGFVSVKLLPPAFKLNPTELAQLPMLSDATVEQFAELRDAFAAPFKFIAIADERWRLVQSQLKQDGQGLYVRTAQGGVIKLQFYP